MFEYLDDGELWKFIGSEEEGRDILLTYLAYLVIGVFWKLAEVELWKLVEDKGEFLYLAEAEFW